MEKVSTTPSDRGRSISSLRVSYEGDMVLLEIKRPILSRKGFLVRCQENMEKVSTTSCWIGRDFSGSCGSLCSYDSCGSGPVAGCRVIPLLPIAHIVPTIPLVPAPSLVAPRLLWFL